MLTNFFVSNSRGILKPRSQCSTCRGELAPHSPGPPQRPAGLARGLPGDSPWTADSADLSPREEGWASPGACCPPARVPGWGRAGRGPSLGRTCRDSRPCSASIRATRGREPRGPVAAPRWPRAGGSGSRGCSPARPRPAPTAEARAGEQPLGSWPRPASPPPLGCPRRGGRLRRDWPQGATSLEISNAIFCFFT